MSEIQEKVWVVMKRDMRMINGPKAPVKSADDRKDARNYARRMNDKSSYYHYTVTGVKKL